jgi:hypothetical protein
VTAIGPGPMDTPFFYPAEGADAVAYHKTAAALSKFSTTGLTDVEDIVPFIRFLGSDGLVDHRPDYPRQWWLHHEVNRRAIPWRPRAAGSFRFRSRAHAQDRP